jgi:acyl carrier protein
MATQEQVLKAIFAAIDEINDQLPPGGRIEKTSSAVLFGRKGGLDSLNLVNFMMAVEQQVQAEFGVNIVITDTSALSRQDNPFQSVETLSVYIQGLLEWVERAGAILNNRSSIIRGLIDNNPFGGHWFVSSSEARIKF